MANGVEKYYEWDDDKLQSSDNRCSGWKSVEDCPHDGVYQEGDPACKECCDDCNEAMTECNSYPYFGPVTSVGRVPERTTPETPNG